MDKRAIHRTAFCKLPLYLEVFLYFFFANLKRPHIIVDLMLLQPLCGKVIL